MFACLYAPGNLPILLECAREFSPLIEVTDNETVTFDIRGLSQLHGPPQQIAREIELQIGIPANIAIASNPDAAVHAARGFSGTTVIPPGMEATRLASLSVNLLRCPPEIGELLEMWGVRTFGQLAKLPPLGLAARLGEVGVYLQQLAQGAFRRQLRVLEESRAFERSLDLEYPIASLESLLFVLSDLIQQLCMELSAAALATNEVRLQLRLERHESHSVTVRLPVPIVEKSSVLKLLQLNLDRDPPSSAVANIHLAMEGVKPQTMQHDLFGPAYPAPERIEVTIARIHHFVGSENAGAARVLDTHRPDSFVMEPFVPTARVPAVQINGPTRLLFRRFRPPQQAKVRTVREQPVHIVSARARGDIEIAKGPWLTSGNWWRADSWNRREWDIAVRAGGIYRIFEERTTSCWFVDGNYD